jgi:uncharacterized protein YyaL (SSP411 family)
MLVSFAEASIILKRDDYREAAINSGQFLTDKLTKDGLLLRTWKDGSAKLNAYLEDYACFLAGLVTLYEITGNLDWLNRAIALSKTMIDEFWDDQEGGFFYTGKSHENLIVRFKDFLDNATPSGNSVAAEVFLRLGVLLGDETYSRQAVAVLRLQNETLARYPSAFGRALSALDFYLSDRKEIAIIGEADSPDTTALLRAVWQRYLPNKVVAATSGRDNAGSSSIPLLHQRTKIDAKATAYVCENYACLAPVTDPTALLEQLN